MDAIIHCYLDKVEDGTIKPSFSQVMLGWGLSHDKVTRTEESKVRHPANINTQVIVVMNASRPDIIEGEVVLDDNDGGSSSS